MEWAGDANNAQKTVTDLVTDIETAFTEIERGAKAKAMIKHIKQRNHSVDAYIQAFNDLLAKTDYKDEAIKIEYYRDGLDPALVKRMMDRDVVPATLKEWQELTARWDATNRIYKESLNSNKPSNIYPSYERTVRYQPRTEYLSPGIPMDVDRSKIKPLTQKERQELIDKNGCFRCRKTGHMSYECKEPRNKYSGPPRRLQGRKPFKSRNADLVDAITSAVANLDDDEAIEVLLNSKETKTDKNKDDPQDFA
jgi:hypothetical protein